MPGEQFRVVSGDGAWCWFQDPRAVRHVGEHDRTYVGWISKTGDVQVASVDHATGETERATLHAGYEMDDHDAPSLYVDREDRLVVFYTEHGGPDIRYRRSEEPESVTDFGDEQVIAPSTGHTYPNPVRLADRDRLFLFYRNEPRDLAFVTSEDDGRTWSEERELVVTDTWRGWGWVYFKISTDGDGRVDVAMSHCTAATVSIHRDVRHAWFDGEGVHAAGGETLAEGEDLPLRLKDAPVIYDSHENWYDAWVWDCETFGDQPAIVYADFRDVDDHRYRYARWTGEEWTDTEITPAGSHITDGNRERYYSGGIALDANEPGVCYASVGDHDGSRLQRWETADGGASWRYTDLTDEFVQNVRPVVPRDRHPDLPVLWMQGSYTHFADRAYDTRIVAPEEET
jgi:hypothetical protein